MKPTLEQLSQEFTQLIGPAPVTTAPVQIVDFAARGVNLDVTVAPDQVVAAAQLLDRHGFSLDTITGVDWLAQGQMEVVYDYMHFTVNLRVAVRTRVPRDQAAVPRSPPFFPAPTGTSARRTISSGSFSPATPRCRRRSCCRKTRTTTR